MTAELQTDCELLRAIYEDAASCPEQVDTTLRLAYADYLQEHGDYDRAELIRVQYELETCSPPHKKLPYSDEPVPMTNRGQGHYTFTDYLRDGLVEGDRVDIYKQRPGKSSKWLYGLRVVKFLVGTGLGEREAVVRIDEHSGPWKGEKLKKRSDELIKLHPEWSRATCPACKGQGYLRDQMGEPMCLTCGGSGNLLFRGDCYRDGPHDSGRNYLGLRWRCGFIDAVEVSRLAEVWAPAPHGYDRCGPDVGVDWTGRNGFACRCRWGSASHGDVCPEHGKRGMDVSGGEPTACAVTVADMAKTLTRIIPLNQQPTREEGGWEWYGLPDALNTPITKATFSSPDAAKDALGRTICLASRNAKEQR